jgi:5-methylcytosine-specific restriction protein A
MATIEELRPLERQRVMDLVEMAGVDVSDWANFKGGKAKAAANPKYCYEWSFVDPGKVVVLNLWHASMKERDGVIFQELNQREVALRYERPPGKPAWALRARRSDLAIQTAFREKLPVRVVICDGKMRDIENDDSEASKVESRMLDPIPWAVTAYDRTTGACIVTRGAIAEPFVDQFDVDSESAEHPERRTVFGEAFVRSAEVRRRVLLRANGVCEFCSQPGFKMPDGRVFLETHHVVPLAAGGLDIAANVVALCPNHHREAHYGVTAPEMLKQLIIKAGATGGCR